MIVLVTTNEPSSIKKLFEDSIELPMRFDLKLFTNQGSVGIERKKVPGDFLASVEDGRLRNEILAMREECRFQVILFHGTINYDKDGHVLIGKRKLHWTRQGIRNLCRTLEWVEGCYIERAHDNQELVTVISELQDYLDKTSHTSLQSRPSVMKTWMIPTHQEKYRYWLQGLPGISIGRASMLCDKFPDPMSLFEADINSIASVRGFGKHTAQKIHDFLRGIK